MWLGLMLRWDSHAASKSRRSRKREASEGLKSLNQGTNDHQPRNSSHTRSSLAETHDTTHDGRKRRKASHGVASVVLKYQWASRQARGARKAVWQTTKERLAIDTHIQHAADSRGCSSNGGTKQAATECDEERRAEEGYDAWPPPPPPGIPRLKRMF
mmetsp:Transcript_6851/g.16637  ORF Transcript_6851/g.16637 Transcript_6851/m.16637 type:complete len:157 (-) Transcript_6851:942-1412(-)